MGIPVGNIRSLSEFQRNAKARVRELKKTGEPVVLTVNGQAEVVVQSAEAYQRLLDEHDLLDSLRKISQGLEQAERGEGAPMRGFLKMLAKERGIALK